MFELRSTFTVVPSTARRPPAAVQERWFAPAWKTLPLAPRRCRVSNPVNGAVAELSYEQHAVLTACAGCRTLAEHAVAVGRKLGIRPDAEATTIKWLGDFAACGLLVPLAALASRLGSAEASPPAPFAGVVIRTCDRPALLARALESAARLEARSARGCRYIVLDDSRDAGNRAANRGLVASVGKLDCTYDDMAGASDFDREMRAAFASAGAEVAWLLGAPSPGEATYGRPVNHALLHTAGRRFLFLDDDALLEPRAPPVAAAGFAVSGDSDELFCFRDEAALERACAPLDVDPVDAHLTCLGAPAGAVWARFLAAQGSPASVELVPGDASRFVADARVLFTQNHAVGDPGSALFPYHLLSLPPASLARLAGEPEAMRVAFDQRFNWRGQQRPRLATRRALTFTTLAGIDNSVLLPPTVRAHRNEDLLLGEMAQHVHPGGWLVDLPWGLPHRRVPPKAWLPAGAVFPQEPIHFLLDYLEVRAPAMISAEPEKRMLGLANLLLDLAEASDERVGELLEEQAADVATRVHFAISSQLDDAALPPSWKDAIRPWLGSPTLATGGPQLRARLAAPASVRRIAQSYGRALVVWPSLWAWSRARAG